MGKRLRELEQDGIIERTTEPATRRSLRVPILANGTLEPPPGREAEAD